MLSTLRILWVVTSKFCWITVMLIYLGLVLTAYRTDGPSFRPPMTLDEPVRSSERFLVWLGVRAVTRLLRASRVILETFFEASADVGERYLSRRALSRVRGTGLGREV